MLAVTVKIIFMEKNRDGSREKERSLSSSRSRVVISNSCFISENIYIFLGNFVFLKISIGRSFQ